MLRILLIDDTPRKIGRLKSALIEAGFEVIDESGLTIDLPERVEAIRPDVVLIDTDSPGRDVLEQVVLVSRDQPRPIVMFTDDSDPDAMRQAIRAGVSAYIVEGIQAQRLKPILDVAMARFQHEQQLRSQLADARSELKDRKTIDRAKGLLMQRQGLSEQAAYDKLRKTAMDKGLKLVDVAQRMLDVMDLLG